jgi:hypothetical protein
MVIDYYKIPWGDRQTCSLHIQENYGFRSKAMDIIKMKKTFMATIAFEPVVVYSVVVSPKYFLLYLLGHDLVIFDLGFMTLPSV